MQTYEVTLPGESKPVRIEAEPAEVFQQVDRMMEGRQGVPTVKPITNPTPAQPATPSPIVPVGAVPVTGNGPAAAPAVRAMAAAVVATPLPSAQPDADPIAPVTTNPLPASAMMDDSDDRNRVHAEGRDRSTADLLAAQAAGFTPGVPGYDRGTLVNGWGVQNARKSRQEHDNLPDLLPDLASFTAQVRGENRRDVEAPIKTLAMREDGTLCNPHDEKWNPEPGALSQLATRLGVPFPRFLAELWPSQRANVWNQLVATAIDHPASTCPKEHPLRSRLDGEKTIRARLRDGRDGKPSMYALVSPKYASCDVDKIADALAEGLGDLEGAKSEITYDGERAEFNIHFHSDVQPEKYVAGEFFKAGINVKANDGGGGGIVISSTFLQNLCRNLIILDRGIFQIANLRHIGEDEVLAARFAKAVSEARGKIDHFLRAWGYATDETVATPAPGGDLRPEGLRLLDNLADDTLSETELLSGVFLGLGKEGRVSVGRDDLAGLLAAHEKDTSSARQLVPVTRASVVNAITRYAHEDVGRHNATKQSELERQAGALLVGSRGRAPVALPFLPPPATRERATA